MAAKKPQGWEDSIPFVNMLRKKTTPKSVKTSVKAGAKAGKKINSTTRSVVTTAFGDPKKGWRDVAVTSGSWVIPYGKGAKVINKAVKGAGKGAKVVRRSAKTAGFVGAPVALSAVVNSTKRRSRTTAKKK